MQLTVYREDQNTVQKTVFFDEKLSVHIKPPILSKLHLSVCVTGTFQSRKKAHQTVIFDEDLPPRTEWRQEIHIRHPRSPLKNPTLEIIATSTKHETHEQKDPEILQPFDIVGSNLTVNPKFEFKRGGKHAKQISTASIPDEQELQQLIIANEEQTNELQQNNDISVVKWQAELVQALEMEVRSVRPALERDRVIAEINLICGGFPVSLSDLQVKFESGTAEIMGTSSYPMLLTAGDNYSLCYNLQLRTASPHSNFAARKPLSLTLDCEIQLENSKPKVTSIWTPVIDFEGTQGPFPKTPALSIPINSPAPMKPAANVEPKLVTNNLSLMGGVSMTITGPQFVDVNSKFKWKVKVVNKSQRSRMFTLTLNNQMPENVLSDLSNLSFSYNQDFLRFRAMQHYKRIGANAGIMPLINELRIGPMNPSSCLETEIDLLALKPGTHAIESSKIEDLNTRDSYDGGGLLEVIVNNNQD